MAGKFMNRNAIIDSIKSEERTNAEQKRNGTNNHVRATVCQCPDPDCGAFHDIIKDRPLPTSEQCDEILKEHNERVKSRHPLNKALNQDVCCARAY